MSDVPGWDLEGFEEALDIWAGREAPDVDLRLVVTAWIFSRHDDPYAGVRREPGFDNLWFGPIPESLRDQRVVVCANWIVESARTIRCDSIATLSLPI
jgi:hypothetical protein